MTKFLLLALLVVSLVSAVAILIANLRGKRVKKAEAEIKTLREAFALVKEKAVRLQSALDQTATIGREANAERKELAETLDSDLVHRANDLFK